MGENEFPRAPKSRFLIRDANGRLCWCVFRSEEEIAAIKEKWKCRQERYQLNKAICISSDQTFNESAERKI